MFPNNCSLKNGPEDLHKLVAPFIQKASKQLYTKMECLQYNAVVYCFSTPLQYTLQYLTSVHCFSTPHLEHLKQYNIRDLVLMPLWFMSHLILFFSKSKLKTPQFQL